jgi:hypothetical protein
LGQQKYSQFSPRLIRANQEASIGFPHCEQLSFKISTSITRIVGEFRRTIFNQGTHEAVTDKFTFLAINEWAEL